MPAASSFRTLMSPGLSAITDTFTGANGDPLGTTDTGQPWEIVAGTWSIQSNRAYTSTASSSNPVALVNAGTSEVSSLTINLGTMDAAIIRALDGANFLRVVRGYYQTSGTSYCSYPNYRYVGDSITCGTCGWSCSGSGCGCNNSSCSIGSGGYCTHPSTACNSNYIACSCSCLSDGTCQVACGTYYYDNYVWRVEKLIAGTATTLYTSPIRSTGISGFTITALGGILTVTDGRDSSGNLTIPTELLNATKFGIGRTNYQSQNSSAIDNFSLTPL